MARNEEKQLARLNRFYLQQQKEEELKKRPPRPRLETLNTVDEVKKWLPSILRDMDFYVSQMEVPCYPQRKIDEITKKVDGLRGEYKAFLRKLRQLEPDVQVTPWSDRPYSTKKRKYPSSPESGNDSGSAVIVSTAPTSPVQKEGTSDFIAITTPILKHDISYQYCYGYEKRKEPLTLNVDAETQDRPLDFNFTPNVSSDQTGVSGPNWARFYHHKTHGGKTSRAGNSKRLQNKSKFDPLNKTHESFRTEKGAITAQDFSQAESRLSLETSLQSDAAHHSRLENRTRQTEHSSLNCPDPSKPLSDSGEPTSLDSVSKNLKSSSYKSINLVCSVSSAVTAVSNCTDRMKESITISGHGSFSVPYSDSSSSADEN